jgi:hypothetical protein
VGICPGLCIGKEDKKEIKPPGPLQGAFDKIFFTSEKLEKSSGVVLRLCLLAFGVSSGNLGYLSNFSPEV